MGDAEGAMVRCGIVLAGGDGRRLQAFVRRFRGDALPKQYVDFTGTGSLLEQTFRRVERLIPSRRLYTVVSRDHFAFPDVWRQLADRPGGSVLVQPENKDTAPGLLLPLASIGREYEDATVAVFPSDHAIANDEAFMKQVDCAYEAVERRPSRVVLLAVTPTGPEGDYGYVLPGPPESDGVRAVTRFVEKPGPVRAAELIQRGGLWNTFVMVFRASTLWKHVWEVAPVLAGAFRRLAVSAGTGVDIDDVYRTLQPLNFSSAFLRRLPGLARPALTVIPVDGAGWSDCGVEARLQGVLGEVSADAPLPLCA
jgi:mannose-1-phosphate guanylyltransferase